MPKAKTKPKPTHGGPRKGAGAPKGNVNRPKGPELRLVSARIRPSTYDALTDWAKIDGLSLSALVAKLCDKAVDG